MFTSVASANDDGMFLDLARKAFKDRGRRILRVIGGTL